VRLLMPENIQFSIEVDRHNPQICRFTSEQKLCVGTRTVANLDEARGIPLAEKLISLPGVARIQLIGHLLVVTKTLDKQWTELASEIESVLTSYLLKAMALTAKPRGRSR